MEVFLRDDVFPSWFANALTKALSVQTSQFQLIKLDATHVQLPAGADAAAAVLAIQGLWRWVEAPITIAHPGGAAGTYPVYATARNNNITASPAPFTDATDYSFQLAILQPGQAPTINAGVIDVFRHVGDAVWDGTQIVRVDQLAPPSTQHAGRHAAGGPDPLTPAMIGAVPAADPTTAQPGDLIFSGATSRVGAVLGDGSAYPRADPRYAALFAAVGTKWGVGDGSTTFNVLDARDKSPIGASVAHPVGSVIGAAALALAGVNLPPHYHGYTGNTGLTSADHTHYTSGTTGTESAGHSHNIFGFSNAWPQGGNTGAYGAPGATVQWGYSASINIQSGMYQSQGAIGVTSNEGTAHTHDWGATSGPPSASHYHGYSGNTDNGAGLTATPISMYHPVYAVNVFVKL